MHRFQTNTRLFLNLLTITTALVSLGIWLAPLALAQAQPPENCMVTPIHLRGDWGGQSGAQTAPSRLLRPGIPNRFSRVSSHPLDVLKLIHTPFPGPNGETVKSLDDALTNDTNAGAPPSVASNQIEAMLGWGVDAIPLSGIQVGNEKVAILLLDDFSHIPAHGWLVMEKLQQLRQVVLYATQLPAANLGLVHVDIGDAAIGWRSANLVPALKDALDQLNTDGFQRFVVIASFALVPCVNDEYAFNFDTFLEQQAAEPQSSILGLVGNDENAVAGLLKSSGDSGLDEFGQAINDLVGGQGDQIVIAVSPSGNFAQPEAFYPARWPGFISVSASRADDDNTPWVKSNAGEVMAPGAWYEFTDGFYRAGTSYAAPVVSMLLALDLTNSSPKCQMSDLTVVSPAVTKSSYANERIDNAISGNC